MGWLKDHEFLAAWLNIPLTVVLAVLQGFKSDSKPLNMRNVVIYLAFLTCLANLISPVAAYSREAAGFAFYILLFHILWNMPNETR